MGLDELYLDAGTAFSIFMKTFLKLTQICLEKRTFAETEWQSQN